MHATVQQTNAVVVIQGAHALGCTLRHSSGREIGACHGNRMPGRLEPAGLVCCYKTQYDIMRVASLEMGVRTMPSTRAGSSMGLSSMRTARSAGRRRLTSS